MAIEWISMCTCYFSNVFLGHNLEYFVDECYKKNYLRVYGHYMQTLYVVNEWPTSYKPHLLAPIIVKQVGRPKNNDRRKSDAEIHELKAKRAIDKAEEVEKIGRKCIIITCKFCGGKWHNKKGCYKRKQYVEEDSRMNILRQKKGHLVGLSL